MFDIIIIASVIIVVFVWVYIDEIVEKRRFERYKRECKEKGQMEPDFIIK